VKTRPKTHQCRSLRSTFKRCQWTRIQNIRKFESQTLINKMVQGMNHRSTWPITTSSLTLAISRSTVVSNGLIHDTKAHLSVQPQCLKLLWPIRRTLCSSWQISNQDKFKRLLAKAESWSHRSNRDARGKEKVTDCWQSKRRSIIGEMRHVRDSMQLRWNKRF